MLARVQVEHELLERPLEPRQRTLQHHEAGARQFCGRLEVHEAERLADLEMLARLVHALERRRLPPAAKLDIVALVIAVRRVVGRKVRDRRELRFERRRRLPFRRLELRHFRLRRGDLGAEIFGCNAILARHRRADLFRGGVAALLRALKRRDRLPALSVERDQRFGARAKTAAPQAFVEGFGILADRSDIVHDPTSTMQGAPRSSARRRRGARGQPLPERPRKTQQPLKGAFT